MDTPANTPENLYELLRDFDTAMMIVRSDDAHIHGRPMGVAQLQKNAEIYFFTRIDSPKISAISANSNVTLTFQSSSQFASLSGRATVEHDKVDL